MTNLPYMEQTRLVASVFTGKQRRELEKIGFIPVGLMYPMISLYEFKNHNNSMIRLIDLKVDYIRKLSKDEFQQIIDQIFWNMAESR